MTFRGARPRVAIRLLLWTTILTGVLSGCGGQLNAEPSSGTPTAVPSQPAAPSPTNGADLTIVVDNGKGKITTWTLTCEPVGGTHPDPAAACKALVQHAAAALPAVPKGRVCSQNFGGPDTATLTGSWKGQPVNSSLNLKNGCEIARWQALAGLLPRSGS